MICSTKFGVIALVDNAIASLLVSSIRAIGHLCMLRSGRLGPVSGPQIEAAIQAQALLDEIRTTAMHLSSLSRKLQHILDAKN